MKKSVLFIVLFCVSLLLSSCGLFDKVDDVSFDTTLTQTITVNESETLTNATYAQSLVLDATSNADIAKYQSHIKGYTINKITYTVSDYSSTQGNVTFSNGQLSFGTGSSSAIVAAIGSLNLKALSDSGTETTLAIDEAGLASISDLLLQNAEITVTGSGVLSQTPVTFRIKVIVYATVKADAL